MENELTQYKAAYTRLSAEVKKLTLENKRLKAENEKLKKDERKLKIMILQFQDAAKKGNLKLRRAAESYSGLERENGKLKFQVANAIALNIGD